MFSCNVIITKQTLQIVGVSVAFLVTNALLNIINGYLFSSTDFKFPLFLTMMHAVIGFFYAYVVTSVQCEGLTIQRMVFEKNWKNMSILTLQGVLFALNVSFNNMSLMFINVTLNQIVKASNPVVTAILCMIVFRRTYSWQYWLGLLAIVCGVVMSVYGNPHFDSFGFFLVCSSVFVACCMVVVSEKIMEGLRMDPINFLMNTAPQIAISIMPFSIARELTGIIEFSHNSVWRLIFILVITGSIAFLYNISHYSLIKLTGSVYSTVMGNFKIALLIILAEIIFYDPDKRLSILNQLGILLTVASFSLISWLKHKEKIHQRLQELEDDMEELTETHTKDSIDDILNDEEEPSDGETHSLLTPPPEIERQPSISEMASTAYKPKESGFLQKVAGPDAITSNKNFTLEDDSE